MPIKIGVLHSTAFTSLMQDNFIDGLQNAGNWTDADFSVEGVEGKYGKDSSNHLLTELELAAKRLAVDCDLIVAASLVAVIAVYNVNLKTGVGLIGRMPLNSAEPGFYATQSGSKVEAIVNLNTSAHNAERANRLMQAPFTVPQGEIALMVNTNSAMGVKEYDEWMAPGNRGLRFPDDAMQHDNKYSHFQQFFRNVPSAGAGRISGIVVSADPFFFRFRTHLIKAALAARPQNDPIKFCFPFAEWQYKDSGPGHPLNDWDNQIHIGYCGTGMDLMPAFRQLGVAADLVLSAHFRPPTVFTASRAGWQRD